MEDEINTSTYLQKLWWGSSWVKHVKNQFPPCHVHGKCSINVSLCLNVFCSVPPGLSPRHLPTRDLLLPSLCQQQSPAPDHSKSSLQGIFLSKREPSLCLNLFNAHPLNTLFSILYYLKWHLLILPKQSGLFSKVVLSLPCLKHLLSITLVPNTGALCYGVHEMSKDIGMGEKEAILVESL